MLNSNPDEQHPFLSYGFRPFFLFAGLYAVLAISAWLGWLFLHDRPGILVTPTFAGPPHLWHGHEMVFGFMVAVITGFMLTAVPSWTGARRVAGTPLLALAVLWLAGRIVVWFSAIVPPLVVAVIDLAFLPFLAAVVFAGLMVRPAPRNVVFALFLLLLTACNWAVHAEWLGWTGESASKGLATATLIISLMVAIIGGRIVPAFTRNVLIQRDPEGSLPRSSAVIDGISVATIAVLVVLSAVGVNGGVTGSVAAFASMMHLLRLMRWQWYKTLRSPILWSLHLSYLFLVFGLAALAASNFTTWLSQTSALHLLAIGAIGSMTLAVMSRAALGHTGRSLNVSKATAVAYVLVALAALCRSLGVEILPGYYMEVLYVSGLFWAAGFGIFAIGYFEILVSPPAPKRGQPA